MIGVRCARSTPDNSFLHTDGDKRDRRPYTTTIVVDRSWSFCRSAQNSFDSEQTKQSCVTNYRSLCRLLARRMVIENLVVTTNYMASERLAFVKRLEYQRAEIRISHAFTKREYALAKKKKTFDNNDVCWRLYR